MKKKIQDMIQGKFNYKDPVLLLPEQKIRFSVVEQADYNGSFRIHSSTEEAVRGVVSCSNKNMSCSVREFEGISTEIRYCYNGASLMEGTKDEGCFIITSNVGEYVLPFEAMITREYQSSSIGKIKTLNDFANLCKLNWKEALSVFSSPLFVNIFHENSVYLKQLYSGLTERGCDSHSMEEFLIGCGKKKRNQFSLNESERTYHLSESEISDSVTLWKTEWGYTDISVSCSENFIGLPVNHIRFNDFTGKHYVLTYRIIPRLLHAGKNYAKIHFETPFGSRDLSLTVYSSDEKQEISISQQKKRLRYELEDSFIDWKFKKSDSNTWMKDSLALISQTTKVMPDNDWNRLFAAYIYLENGKKEEAENEVSDIAGKLCSQRSPMGAFYLYLTTYGEDDNYKKEVTSRVREIYLKHTVHPVVNWVLLQIDATLLRNPERKYQMIRRYMSDYSISPIFYLEAAQLLLEHPELLVKTDSFSNRLLAWMSRRNLLSEELSGRIELIAQSRKKFDRSFYHILCRCYKKYPDDSLMKTICVYLIRMNCYGECYFPWFKKGFEKDLKIAGLYEAYLLSWSKAEGEIPSEIIKYFAAGKSLSAQKKAMLFAYIVRNRKKIGKDWDAYMVMVKNFAIHELGKNHMSDDLAVICEQLKHDVTPKEWRDIGSFAEHSHKVIIDGATMSNVRVYQLEEPMKKQRVPLNANQAFIQLNESPYLILLEDSYGNLYCSDGSCRTTKMLASFYRRPEKTVPTAESAPSGEESETQSDLLRILEAESVSMGQYAELITKAEQQGIAVLSYKEKLMVRMLFTSTLIPNHENYFEAIKDDPEAVQILLGYISLVSRNNMMTDTNLSEWVFRYIGDLLSAGHRLNAYCRAAFLRYFVSNPLPEYQELAQELLFRYLKDGIYFDFLKNLPIPILRKYLLLDLQIITFRGEYHQTLLIRFPDGRKETLNEVIPGIYTAVFHMYGGETVSYEILSRDGDVIFNDSISMEPCSPDISETKYAMISGLLSDPFHRDHQYAYAELEDLTNILFQPVKE